MPRPLFGFRQRHGEIVPEPTELALVRRVLTAQRGARMQAARMSPSESSRAVIRRIQRITAHRDAYLSGRVLLGVPASRRLAKLITARGLTMKATP